jgi:hypothetical protein
MQLPKSPNSSWDNIKITKGTGKAKCVMLMVKYKKEHGQMIISSDDLTLY